VPKVLVHPDVSTGEFFTDGRRLFEVVNVEAHVRQTGMGARLTGGFVVTLDDCAVPVGTLQPGLRLSASELHATMTRVSHPTQEA
jgi:hypothetical protein